MIARTERRAAVAAAPVRVALVSAGEIYGGVERFLSTFSAHLVETRVSSPFVVLFFDGRLARELRAARVAVAVSPYRKYDPRVVRWLSGMLRDEMIDVVHAHGYKAGVIGGLAARLAGIPAVKTEHGALEPFHGPAALKMRMNLFLDGIVTSRLFQETVYITGDLLVARQLAGRRGACVIPNGIAPIDEKRVPARPTGEFHIGIVGRLSPVKGHAVLFDAMRLLKNRGPVRVHVFGTGPLESDLRRRAEEFGSAVGFHGFREDILVAMTDLDCLVMPSSNEGLPYTLLEAMHLGLPIVASRVGGMREILTDGVTALLFEPGDAAALAARIDSLVADRALGRRLGATARDRARAHFGIAEMAASYVKLYREVME